MKEKVNAGLISSNSYEDFSFSGLVFTIHMRIKQLQTVLETIMFWCQTMQETILICDDFIIFFDSQSPYLVCYQYSYSRLQTLYPW